jgi:hypothetical protein
VKRRRVGWGTEPGTNQGGKRRKDRRSKEERMKKG